MRRRANRSYLRRPRIPTNAQPAFRADLKGEPGTAWRSVAAGTRRGRLPEFWVITCYFNPCGYSNRRRNYLAFAQGLRQQQVNLLTVELVTDATAKGDLDDAMCDRYVRVEQPDVLWAKERLLNIGLRHLPPDCRHVCWADCDLLFEQPDWARRCNDLLYHHRVVQPFHQCIFLDEDETPATAQRHMPTKGFARMYEEHGHALLAVPDMLKGHPGYAWAARLDVLHATGGLYDGCILGHGDVVMALGFAHDAVRDGPLPDTWFDNWNPHWGPALRADARAWQRRASRATKGDVVALGGRVHHMWHGPAKNRDYCQRGHLIADFDPHVHLATAPSGMWAWTEEAKAVGLPERVRSYFERRREDDRAAAPDAAPAHHRGRRHRPCRL